MCDEQLANRSGVIELCLKIIAPANLDKMIQDVVVRLPEDVFQWAIDNITFVDFSGFSGLACRISIDSPSEHKTDDDVRLLIIVQDDGDESEDRSEFQIAHEIAQHWCRHSDRRANGYELQEQANLCANNWGYPGSSTRVPDDQHVAIGDLEIIGDANIYQMIREVVARLPDDVSKWVIGNITFVDFSGITGLGCRIPIGRPSIHRMDDDAVAGIRLLIILQNDEDESEERSNFRIAHEIAHHWCKQSRKG